MKFVKRSSLESFGLSLAGHAILVLILIGFSAVVPQKVIAPDRIRIEQIDLRDVKIEGLETKLRNQEQKKTEPAKTTAIPSASKKTVAAQTPQIRTIKVNRDTAGLERTMTVSVIDAFRIAMTMCWQIDTGRKDLEGIRAVAHLQMAPDGRVKDYWFEQATRADRDPVFAYVLETIKYAIEVCSPFSMLPRKEYDKWKSVQLSFFPTAKVVE